MSEWFVGNSLVLATIGHGIQAPIEQFFLPNKIKIRGGTPHSRFGPVWPRQMWGPLVGPRHHASEAGTASGILLPHQQGGTRQLDHGGTMTPRHDGGTRR